MKPINTTKLLIRMTNVYMKNIDKWDSSKNIDMMFSLNHMTIICIKFHILMRITGC